MPEVQPIGIDLGTTCSAVAYVDEHGKTAMVRNGEGELLTPSVVLFDEGEIIVGREAKKAAGYYTEEHTPDAAALAETKGRGLTDY